MDDLERSVSISDTETIEFLITKAVGRLWSRVLRSENVEQDLADLHSHNPGSYGSRVRERFLAQFNGANTLALPEGYSFRKEDKPLLPNLMQRLVAHRVDVDRRVGNWSGTGAGKTLGAILASRVIGAKLTVIVALNNTILDVESGWPAEILNAFPENHVIIKERGTLSLDGTKSNYLLLNYEAFQVGDSQAFVKALDSRAHDRLHRARRGALRQVAWASGIEEAAVNQLSSCRSGQQEYQLAGARDVGNARHQLLGRGRVFARNGHGP